MPYVLLAYGTLRMVTMSKIYGNFCEMGDTQEYLIISFSSTMLPIQERWRNNSLSADFLAAYWGTFFPVQKDSPHRDRSEVQDTVSFIANELLENALKFHHEDSRYPIRIGIYLLHDHLRFYVNNCILPPSAKRFEEYIQKLSTEDPYELYIQQLENNAEEEHVAESRLGFLTMINDYNAEIAWKFEIVQQEPEIVLVTTMVRLAILREEQ